MDKYYKWRVFYYNPDVYHFIYLLEQDNRVFIPKSNKWMGWTINFGNIKGQIATAGVFAALGILIGYNYKKGKKMHYSFSELYDIIKTKYSKSIVCYSNTY